MDLQIRRQVFIFFFQQRASGVGYLLSSTVSRKRDGKQGKGRCYSTMLENRPTESAGRSQGGITTHQLGEHVRCQKTNAVIIRRVAIGRQLVVFFFAYRICRSLLFDRWPPAFESNKSLAMICIQYLCRVVRIHRSRILKSLIAVEGENS